MATEIIDTLAGVVGEFTVAASVPQVAVDGLTVAIAKANGEGIFANVDNVTILAMGVNLPYQYCNGDGLFSVFLEWIDEDQTETAIPIYFGYLPLVNNVFSFGAGLYSQNPQPTHWPTKQSRIRMGIASGNVSQVYTPPLIPNGDTLDIQGWIQIRHLLPMEA